jgi:hypothetical protein
MSSAYAQKIYYWKDEKGVINVTTTPPPDNVRQYEVDSWGKQNSFQKIPIRDSEVQKQPPATIDQLPVSITIRQPDSIGNVYIDAKYTNNSNRNIVSFRITVLLKDTNEKTYLSNIDTVLPGETSPIYTTFGPKSLNMTDIEFLKYEISIENKDGSQAHVEYDPKLNKYDWRLFKRTKFN